MEQALSLILTIISFLLAMGHICFVVLLKQQKLKLHDFCIWIAITIISIFIAIIQLVYQVTFNVIPIFPIMGIIGLTLLCIALLILIRKFKKPNH